MKKLALEGGIDAMWPTINAVTEYGMTDECEVDPDLMCASSLNRDFE
jgi:hypothetical protein